MRVRGIAGWHRVVARNNWFQRWAVHELSRTSTDARDISLFAYSYAALDIFKLARAKGWCTVLGQIDPGPVEERIVSSLYEASADLKRQWKSAPPLYWARWREECKLADEIVVNSAWSKGALVEEGIDASKIRVVPLAYKGSQAAVGFKRDYPAQFTAQRPLRVLFLGQINLRKGVGPLLEASERLRGEHIEFWLVGPLQIPIPPKFAHAANIKWFGQVVRSETDCFYRQADVFIFPTYSDGFGLTQLEAQAWQLPIIASRSCGEVVKPGVNGLLLDEISPQAIANILRVLSIDAQSLKALAAKTPVEKYFTLGDVGASLLELAG
jgi:glycosyltransferase involved in cell wall biosynthesis